MMPSTEWLVTHLDELVLVAVIKFDAGKQVKAAESYGAAGIWMHADMLCREYQFGGFPQIFSSLSHTHLHHV